MSPRAAHSARRPCILSRIGSDWLRIGRIYLEAGEWDKATGAFDKALAASPKDAPWMAEIGGHYNMKGDRAKAEEYFAKSFSIESDELMTFGLWPAVTVRTFRAVRRTARAG